MSDLAIRRDRGLAAPRYVETVKTEKPAGSGQTQRAAGGTGLNVSSTMQQLMSRLSQAESHTRESRRTLQMGEAVLDEIQDSLSRMAELARRSAAGGSADRAALQEELEGLRENIDRMLRGAAAGDVPLFLDGEIDEDGEALLYPVADDLSPGQEGVQRLPDWLVNGMSQAGLTKDEILAALGLDKTAGGSQLLAAVLSRPLGAESAVDRLAALYLGAVIAGGGSAQTADPAQALEGLRQLMEKIGEGLSPDEAVELLTDGAFTSLSDFQTRFAGGTIPGLEQFLSSLLLSEGGNSLLTDAPLLALFAGLKGADIDLMMTLLTAGRQTETGEATETAARAENMTGTDAASGNMASVSSVSFGAVRVTGEDLSGVSFRPETGVLTVSGTGDVTIQGTGQGEQAVLITGSGQVTLRDAAVSTLTIDVPQARVLSEGETAAARIRLEKGVTLTLGGDGLLRIGAFRAGDANVLRVAGGAVTVSEGEKDNPGTLPLPVLVDGPVSLAARAASVSNVSGKPLEPFDVIWKALLPGWSRLTAVEMEGRQAKMNLLNGEPARLWLEKGDPSHGYTIHTLIFRGKDASGRLRTRYAYLRWNQRFFEEISMYPNPFSVTGGESGRDWIYEEESRTLHILSSQVTGVSGGAGTDANQSPFSGRIVLADGIGAMELSLGGVTCRVSAGRAFDLGRENDVTLILESGTSNLFESGTGCAGISLGEGTTLSIDCANPPDGGAPNGILTATGGAGSAGIGWDGSGRRGGHILIRGGAGIGMGKRGFTGSVTIVGGMTVSAAGREGGENMGISLQLGVDTVTLPQFRLSSRALRLDRLSVMTREYARAAEAALEADRRWVSQIQEAYGALYRQLDRSVSDLHSAWPCAGGQDGLVRDTAAAGALMEDMRQSILHQPAQAAGTHGRRGIEDIQQLLR